MRYVKPLSLIVMPATAVMIILMLVVPCGSVAGVQVTTTSDDQTKIAITIYNDGTGLVKDTRDLEFPRGEFDLVYMDVASTIDPTSVHFVSNTNPDSLGVLEQNYEYDLVNTQALFRRNIDNQVSIRTEDGRTIEGTLLSYDGGLVISTAEGIMIVSNPVEINFAELPEGLITRPTLRWNLTNNNAGVHSTEMNYLASGMGWSANYVAIVSQNDDKLDLSGWVTINNNSGTSYKDAELKLVAGEVNRVQPDYNQYADGMMRNAAPMGAMGGPGGFEEETFFEYHLYTLQRPATVLNNQQKQISLLEGEGINVEKIFVFDPGYSYYGRGDTAQGVIEVRLQFMNEEENGLGMPLPKGILRVYKEDSSGALQFIGEDRIDHTPKDEEIEVFLGEAFDIVGERRVMDRREIRYDTWEYDVEVDVRNHKTDDVEIVYWDHVWGDWQVMRSNYDYYQKDASTVEFTVPVESDGEVTLTYTIRREW
ncbi:MAG TPA: DUF4139 domain-containing protein [bacterium]|jgi:hypothetical protein